MAIVTERVVATSGNQPRFEDGAAGVLRDLQAAFSAVVAALPAEARKASDVQKALGLDPKLGWQVFKVARAPSIIEIGTNIPSRTSMNRLFRAARACNVPADVIAPAEAAFEQFERFVARHADDRASFESMVSALDDDGSEQIDLLHKRAAFRAQSHIWGVRAHCSVLCHFLGPAPESQDLYEAISIRGMLGLRRLRRDASWVVSRARLTDDDGVVRHQLQRRPIDPEGPNPHGVSLLREFCSDPLPRFREVDAGNGFTNILLDGDSVGNTAAVNCVIADHFSAFSRYRDEHNSKLSIRFMVRTPCEELLHDVCVARGLFADTAPRVLVYGDQHAVEPAPAEREADLLSIKEAVQHVGQGVGALHSPVVPRYVELGRYVLDRVGWGEEEFDVYRCRVQYPVMPSSVVVQFDLPQSPKP